MTAPRSDASWERVLAAIEADAARATALLASDDALAEAGISYDDPGAPAPVDVPATWRLPDQATAAAHEPPTTARRGFAVEPLPDLIDMPPLTPEVRARLAELHEQIATLQDELRRAMSEAEELILRPSARAAALRSYQQAGPELVDRRL